MRHRARSLQGTIYCLRNLHYCPRAGRSCIRAAVRLGTCAAAALRTLKELSVWFASPVCNARGHPSTSTFKEFVQSTVSPAAKARIDSAWASMGTNVHAPRALRMLSSEVWCQSVMTSSQSAPSVIPMVLFHQRKANVARVQGSMRRGACDVMCLRLIRSMAVAGPRACKRP